MRKEVFEKYFIDKLNNNFQNQSKFFEFELDVFDEFNSLIFEINKCLILELNRAAITLTNHMLERLLKLALIYCEAGIGPKPIENWNDIFTEPNRKYNSITLANSVEKCKKHNLITEKEKKVLFNTIRELMRNGFSHADSTKILENLPNESEMYHANLINPTNIQKVGLNQKIIPFMQALQLEEFAKEHAKDYFEFVFNLTFKIEKRLKIKD